MIEVTLTREEWTHAAHRGVDRQIDGILRNRTPGTQAGRKSIVDGWNWNINGACGEACVAKWLGVPWDGSFGNLRANDVAFLEVRTTIEHDYPLRIEQHDKDGSVYILVTGTGPSWRIQGFILGAKGKRREWLSNAPPPHRKPSDRTPAHWVPQAQLNRDLDLLKRRFLARHQERAS